MTPVMRKLTILSCHLILTITFHRYFQSSNDFWQIYVKEENISHQRLVREMYIDMRKNPHLREQYVMESVGSLKSSMYRLCQAWNTHFIIRNDIIQECIKSNPCVMHSNLTELHSRMASYERGLIRKIVLATSVIKPEAFFSMAEMILEKGNLTLTDISYLENRVKKVPEYNNDGVRLLKTISIHYLDFALYHEKCIGNYLCFYLDIARKVCTSFVDRKEKPSIVLRRTKLGSRIIQGFHCNIGKKLAKKIKLAIARFFIAMSLPLNNDLWAKYFHSSLPMISVCLPFQLFAILTFIVFPKVPFLLRTIGEVLIPVTLNYFFGCGCMVRNIIFALKSPSQRSSKKERRRRRRIIKSQRVSSG